MFKRPHYIAIVIGVFLALILISLPSRTVHRLKLAVSSLFLPLFGLAGSVHGLADQTGNPLRSRKDLLAEREKLHRENQQLRLQAVQSAQVWEENNRLRDAIAWKRQTQWRAKLAQVVLRDPSNLWRTMHINLGQRDGITTNMAVVTASEGFLVGRVNSVAYSWSQVVLVGDPNCRVSALVEGTQNRASGPRTVTAGQGVIKAGASSLDPTVVNLTYLDRQSPVSPGQRVVTSGLGEIFPPGIPIGHVADVSGVGFGLYLEARVKLAAHLANLREVWVIVP